MSDSVRLNVNVPKKLLSRLDAYADDMNINRTSAVAVLLSQSLDAKESMSSINQMVEFMKLKGTVE